MDDTRVSVVIPTYNWSNALALSLQSAVTQTIEDIEIIVVGDGCTDDSEEIIKNINDNRVRWINLPKNSGSQSEPNNIGIQEAKSKFIAYLGHDDLWHPTHLEKLLNAQKQNDADYIFSAMILYGPPDTDIRSVAGLPLKNIPQRHFFIPPSAIMHKKNLADKIGGWKKPTDIGYPVDYDFQIRAWDHGLIIANTGVITAFKFPAAWYRDSYKKRDVSRQRSLLSRMNSDTNFLEKELIEVAKAANNHLFHVCDSFKPAKNGEYFSTNSLIRGIKDPHHINEVISKDIVYSMDAACHAFEWHEIEKYEDEIFRWTGPRTESVLDIPYNITTGVEIRIHIIYAITENTFKNLEIFINNQYIKFDVDPHPKQGWLLTAFVPHTIASSGFKNNIRLLFKVPQTFTFFELRSESFDRRYVGIAVADCVIQDL